MACQIAKLMGYSVIGSAKGADKCAYLRELWVDEVIDYKSAGDLTAALRATAPGGIDVYFDSLGGGHLAAAPVAAGAFGRFGLCGMISQHNAAPSPEAAPNLLLAVGKRLWLQGFIVTDHINVYPGSWSGSGRGCGPAKSRGGGPSTSTSKRLRTPASNCSPAAPSVR